MLHHEVISDRAHVLQATLSPSRIAIYSFLASMCCATTVDIRTLAMPFCTKQ